MVSEIEAVLRHAIGQTFLSEWLLVDQQMIDDFATVTGDRQFIHVDPVAAAATPFGTTIAHGLLLTALLPQLRAQAPAKLPPGIAMGINYGFDRIRFVSPVPSGSRIRGRFTPVEVVAKRPGEFLQTDDFAIEREGSDRPAVLGRLLALFVGG
ncbi:MAG TPA: MaoC family dehydratase [Allosphingosinicella sp.]|nr:MaoC family dehydratase [Allosphingosinicella sp.]